MQGALLLKYTNRESSALRGCLESRVERALPSAFSMRRAPPPPSLRGFLNASRKLSTQPVWNLT